MEASRIGVKLRTISAHDLSARDFTRTIERRLHCFRYQPLQNLTEALARYGFLEVYINGAAKLLLESPDSITAFIRNQKSGMPFEANLLESFPGQKVWVLRHETDDILAFLAGPQMIRERVQFAKDRQEDPKDPLVEVIEQETGRTFVRVERPTLDTIEGNIHSADDFQAMETLVNVMLQDFPVDKEDK